MPCSGQPRIQGAALATILAQFIAMCWQLWLFSNPKELIHFRRGIYGLDKTIIRNILAIGISPFSMNACACIIVIIINTALVRHGGDLAVGAYGIANRIGFLFFMIVMGINQGMQPIAGYNYGARQWDRMLHVLKLSMIFATLVMAIGWLVGELLPYPCARLFTRDEELIAIAARGIRINMLVFPMIGSQAVITNFFQSIGKAKISIFLSLSRQMIFLLPLLIILPPIMGVDGVWAALPASDTVAFIVTWIIMIRYMRRFREMKVESIHQ